MQTRTIWQKLKSTKLWCAIAGIALGVILAVGGNGAESDIQAIAGCVTALISAITYIVTEGKIDAASASTIGTALQGIIEYISDMFEVEEGILVEADEETEVAQDAELS